jgi:hypothetical protein
MGSEDGGNTPKTRCIKHEHNKESSCNDRLVISYVLWMVKAKE